MTTTVDLGNRLVQHLKARDPTRTVVKLTSLTPSEPPLHSPHSPSVPTEPFPILRSAPPVPDSHFVTFTPGFPPPPNCQVLENSPYYPTFHLFPSPCPSCGCTCRSVTPSQTSPSSHSNDTYRGHDLSPGPSAAATPSPVVGHPLDILKLRVLKERSGSRMNQLERSVRLAEAMLGPG